MCTFNRIINIEHVIVQFHVDDLKVPEKDWTVLDDFLDTHRSKFGLKDVLKKNKGPAHKYLGITFAYSIRGKVILIKFDYLEEVIVEFA